MKTLLVIAALCLSAHAQTWIKVATEANTLTISAPVTVRYGTSTGTTSTGVNCASGCWAVVNLTSATNLNLSDTNGGVFGVADPAPGLVKELDVQQGPAALTVTVSGKAVKVPAATTTYLITCTATATVPIGQMPATLPLTNQTCTATKQ